MVKESNWISEHLEKLMEIRAEPNWSEKTGPFFHLQIPGEGPLGPFPAVKLKTFFESHDFPEGTMIKDAKSTDTWQEVFFHPYFQRRKPQLVGISNISEKTKFHLLMDGQKKGPFSIEQVYEYVINKEILLSNLISTDEGRTWKKVYQFEFFDRRNLKQESLPSSPSFDLFMEGEKEIQEELKKLNDKQKNTQAIAGIAFLENVKSGKVDAPIQKVTEHKNINGQNVKKEEEVIPSADKQEPLSESLLYLKNQKQEKNNKTFFQSKVYPVVVFSLLLGSIFFLSKVFLPKSGTSKKYAKKASLLNKKKSLSKTINNKRNKKLPNSYRSSNIKRKKSPRSRRPASFTGSRSFKNQRKRMQDDPYDNESYDPYDESEDYDIGDGAVEQDIVRSKIDKRTFDSEETYLDSEDQEAYEEAYEASIDSESLDSDTIAPAEVWGSGDDAIAVDRLPGSEFQDSEDDVNEIDDEYMDQENY